MKTIITISREFGAGGGEIGDKVAQKLGFELYDKAIILRTARESNIGMENIMKWDEKTPTNFGFAQSLFDFYNRPLSEQLFNVQRQVIRQLAEQNNCVIVGRNANEILREFERTLHIFITADFKWRLERMSKTMPDITANKIKAIDKARSKNCTHNTDTVFGAAKYYDMSLNTSELGIDTCVDIICELAKRA